MRTLWIIAGMRRSGIHAVVDWLLSGLDGPYILLNNVRFDRVHRKANNMSLSPGYETSRTANEHVVTVFEDKRLDRIDRAPLLQSIRPSVDTNRKLIIIRDPYNLTASRLHRTRVRKSRDTRPQRVPSLWPDHASAQPPWIRCIYNRWIADDSYRKQLAAELQISQCPPRSEHVARAGRGSSFDGLTFDGRASEMDVSGRWRQYADDPVFRQCVGRPEIARLSAEVCLFPSPLEQADDS